MFQVQAVSLDDWEAWLAMRGRLWPAPPGAHRAETAGYFETGRIGDLVHGVLMARLDGVPVGFAEVSHSPGGGAGSGNAHLEGWYVEASHRGRGAGRALVEACATWAAARGCERLTSDTTAEYEAGSAPAHLACGFVEGPARLVDGEFARWFSMRVK